MDDAGILIICVGILIVLVVALVFLVNKTKEEEERTQKEIEKLVKSLPEASRSSFLVQYNAQKKSPVAAIVLALFLGGLGTHKFYLGQVGLGIVYLLFFWTGIPAIIAFFEAFTLSRTVHKMNGDIARRNFAMFQGDAKAVY